jgi:hypothetical protein
VLFAFLIGAQCLLTLGAAIEAGVSTIFVGLAEDPQVLQQRSPELFAVRDFFFTAVWARLIWGLVDGRADVPAGRPAGAVSMSHVRTQNMARLETSTHGHSVIYLL